MGALTSYQMRLERKRLQVRAARKRFELTQVADRTRAINKDDILSFTTLRNELVRLPYFLKYYRKMGVAHFLIVDNGSDDGSREYLADQPDVSLWTTGKSYKKSRFGVDWLNGLQQRFGHDHWCLVVDVDELLIYPFCDTRPIGALTDWLDASDIRSFGAMLIDMYPRGPIDEVIYKSGQDPLDITAWFDSGNYTIRKNHKFLNLWIQGGPRARTFFYDAPESAPALNKVPLVKWQRGYAYASSTHMLVPRGLNLVYDEWGGEKTSGCLLHTKFLHTFAEKSAEEMTRGQHFAESHEYKAYRAGLQQNETLWCKWSEKYINWRQMEILGLMSKGNWA